jgi:hypothetical protein
MFATGNYDDDPGDSGIQQDYATPTGTGTVGINNRTITIPVGQSAGGQSGAWAYFGCYLNVYDQAATYNGVPVTKLLNDGQLCLVAQIAADGAPIQFFSGPPDDLPPMGPANCDKLALRTFQFTTVPVTQVRRRHFGAGAIGTPHTLDLRASIADQDEESYHTHRPTADIPPSSS